MTTRRPLPVQALGLAVAGLLLVVAAWCVHRQLSSGATVTLTPLAPTASSSDSAADPAAGFTPSAEEIEMAIAILTQPDEGKPGQSYRFAGPQVTYRVDLGDYPADYQSVVREAFAFVARATGLEVLEVTGDADIVVRPKDGNGAYTRLWPNRDHTINHVDLQLGCCRPRAAWEDVLQSFGPAGDHGDARSVFSEDVESRQAPSAFDAWVLRLLYSQGAGVSPEQLRTAASSVA